MTPSSRKTNQQLTSPRAIGALEVCYKQQAPQDCAPYFRRSGRMMCTTATISSPIRSDTRVCGVTMNKLQQHGPGCTGRICSTTRSDTRSCGITWSTSTSCSWLWWHDAFRHPLLSNHLSSETWSMTNTFSFLSNIGNYRCSGKHACPVGEPLHNSSRLAAGGRTAASGTAPRAVAPLNLPAAGMPLLAKPLQTKAFWPQNTVASRLLGTEDLSSKKQNGELIAYSLCFFKITVLKPSEGTHARAISVKKKHLHQKLQQPPSCRRMTLSLPQKFGWLT